MGLRTLLRTSCVTSLDTASRSLARRACISATACSVPEAHVLDVGRQVAGSVLIRARGTSGYNSLNSSER